MIFYGILFTVISLLLGYTAFSTRGASLLLLWPAANFLVLGIAYFFCWPAIFGKRRDGTMTPLNVLLMLPYLFFCWLVWGITRIVSREDCSNEIVPGLHVGRRPLAHDVPREVTLVVDLTAEFPETPEVMKGREYLVIPTLDGTPPHTMAFSEAAASVSAWNSPVYIHCAEGHGRAATFAAAVLLTRGIACDIESALEMLKEARPAVRLKPRQRKLLQSYWKRNQSRVNNAPAHQ
jgi:protein-tyrosine phosphatase